MTATVTRPASGALRRYPVLVLLLAAAAVATLLPSALRVPISGPQQTAELAPVPGKSSHDSGDLAELGASATRGLGSGTGPGSMGAGGGLEPLIQTEILSEPEQGRGTTPPGKRCVGRPLRQTEDALSPPCVAHYKGNNGGETTKGVTGDEIRVVLLSPCATVNFAVDYWDEDASSQDGWNIVFDAYQRYFTERYQLYGRRLHFFGYAFTCGSSAAQQARNAVVDVDNRWSPFAILIVATGNEAAVADEAAQRGIFVSQNTGRDTAQKVAPFLISFPPDFDDRAEIEAAFVCEKLAGGVARFSGNPLDTGKTRKFGIIHDPSSGTGRVAEELIFDKDKFLAALERRCNITNVPEATGKSPEQRPTALNALRDQGVTTVLYYAKYLEWAVSADAIKWYPEWVIGGTRASGVDARQQPTLVMEHALGTTYSRRRDEIVRQPWYEAFQEACPGCTLSSAGGPVYPRNYDDLTLLMWGVQAAGPKLTPANVDRGLHAIQPRPSPDPYTPATYFAPGNYSWVKDAAMVWWDSQAVDQAGLVGCYKLVEHGKRYRAHEWSKGDAGFQDRSLDQPCQGPLY